jgi:YidC/Oxa1 family membrane protein insertase
VSLFKEVKELIRYTYHIPADEKQIVFYAEHEGYFAYFEGLVNELVQECRQPICYITSDKNDPCLSRSIPGMHTFYLNKLLPYYMVLLKCKVFVMTLTELNQYQFKRSANPVHYVYVFHAMVSTHMMYTKGAFDHYDSILCTGDYQIKELRRYEELRSLNKKELVEAGYYRLERIHDNFKRYAAEKPDNPRKTILVAPSWGKDNILASCGEALIKILLENSYSVIVRPHPEAVRRAPEVIDALDKTFSSHPDFFMERSVSTDDSLLKADLLISDCSGVVLEYAFGTERPVLFIDVPYKIQNKEYEELGMEPFELTLRDKIGIRVANGDLDSVIGAVEELLRKSDDYKEKITALRERNIFAFGTSSKVGADHILKKIKKGAA